METMENKNLPQRFPGVYLLITAHIALVSIILIHNSSFDNDFSRSSDALMDIL